MKIKRWILTSAAALTVSAHGGVLFAQTTANEGQVVDPAAQSQNASIAEIVVTAQKRSERLQDVPIAVTALSADSLLKTGIETTAGLSSIVPGLNINNSISGFRPFLRGVGTTTSSAGNENSVSVYLDGVYLSSRNSSLLNLASIKSIEVLKGPQGTLFGRNATGGIIHVRTKDPSHDTGGDLSLSLNNYRTGIANAYVTGGISDTLAADLAIYYRKQYDGYGKNLATGNDIDTDENITLRSKLLFTPTSNDTFTLAADYSRVDGSGQVHRPFPGTTVQWGPPTATQPAPRGAPYVFTGGTWDVALGTDPFLKAWFGGASLTYEHQMPWASLTSITAYRKSKLRQAWNAVPIPTNAQIAGWTEPDEEFSQELQVNSLPASPVKWIVGLYYLDASVGQNPFFIAGTVLAPTETQFRSKQTTRAPAMYGQFTVPVTGLGDTNVTGGLRYTIDERAIVGRTEIVQQANPSVITATANPTDASKTFNTFTWRLGIDHHLSPDTMIYASYNRGFKAGAYNAIPPGGPTAQPTNPEYLDAYEIGMKNTLLDDAATLNVSAFYYKYRDLQVTIFNSASAITANAAAAVIKGLDIDFNIQATRSLRISAGAELLDHKFSEYKNGPIITPLTLAQGGGAVRTFGDLDGKRLPYASDAVLNLGVFYNRPTSIGEFDANVNLTWNDGFTFEPSEVVSSGSFEDLNATVGLTLNDGTTRISAFGRNLTNAAIPRAVNAGANPGGYIGVLYNPPRTYGLAVSLRF